MSSLLLLDFTGCRTETGLFGITWASTDVGETDTQLCPSGDGEWFGPQNLMKSAFCV